MAQITLKNAAGNDTGTVELDDALFGIEPNVPVMHQVVTAQLAARRAGTQSTKTRSEVRGGGAKPYRQKGTGNARQGSIRSPQFAGGGVALGPKPRSYAQKTPKKMVKLALRSALSDRAAEGKVLVVDEWGWDAPSTKSAKLALTGLGLEGTVLVVVGRDDAAAALSFRNLPEVQVIAPAELNAYDVLCNEFVVFTADSLPASGAEAPAPAAVAADEPTAVDEPTEDEPTEDESTDAPEGDAEFEASQWEGGVVADADGNGPDTHLIKGNADSMLYHVPGSSHYKRTKAEVWFDTEESAEAAGFQKPASQRSAPADDGADGDDAASAEEGDDA